MLVRRRVIAAVAAILVPAFAPLARAQDSCPEWSPGLAGPSGTNATVRALTTFDDGTGVALYAGGDFTIAGRAHADHVARWDGTSWAPLGDGLDGSVFALATFDDGTGAALYAGGDFTHAGGAPADHVARWDGAAWAPLGTGVDRAVRSLLAWDDGSGTALFAGGEFITAGGAAAFNIARWDGAAWSALGSGVGDGSTTSVDCLAAHDDGSGPALYAGGRFARAGEVAATNIARWDGAAWSALLAGLNDRVSTLVAFDDGAGAQLYAGGAFTGAGAVFVGRCARWDGTRFFAVGGGIDDGAVFALHVLDDGATGPRLYAGGSFTRSGITTMNHVARLISGSWVNMGTGQLNGVDDATRALATFDFGSGPKLHVGGDFLQVGNEDPADHVGYWDLGWQPFAVGGMNERVQAIASFDAGAGPDVYAAGVFGRADGERVGHIARWTGAGWAKLADGLDDDVFALRAHDDGSGGGKALYVGGAFLDASGLAVSRVARWDGAAWSAVGGGLPATVRALAEWDDGTGVALYSAGDFDAAGGAIRGLARWDGTSWSVVGGAVEGTINALAVYDDGARRVLAAGGFFQVAGGVVARNVAIWDGTAWSPLGSGTSANVFALASFDDGSGPALYAGGLFNAAGGVPIVGIARWDGSAWTALGSGVNGHVNSLLAFDDGSGPGLYLGGRFQDSGGTPIAHVMHWDGTALSLLGDGPDGEVAALAGVSDDDGLAIWAGGSFLVAGGTSASRIARWFDPCAACRAGNVNVGAGLRTDVVFVNGSAGGAARRITLGMSDPIGISVSAVPLATGVSPFALYLWVGATRPEDARSLPRGFGTTCRPTPLSGGSPRLKHVFNNTGKSLLGAPTLPSSPAPSVVVNLPGGAGRRIKFFVQGLIADPGSAAAKPGSVTNGVEVVVQ